MNKKITKIIASLLMGVMLTMMLVGCGGPKTLESYYSKPLMKAALNQQIELQKSANSSFVTDMNITFSGNTMTNEYILKDAIADEDVETFDKLMHESLAAEVKGQYGPIRQESGISAADKITLIYVYKNPDGKVVSKCEFTEN